MPARTDRVCIWTPAFAGVHGGEAEGPDRVRQGREAAYRFMTAVAGDLPGYEEATRSLFAGDAAGFETAVAGWPEGVREHVRMLAGRTWRDGEA